MFKKGVRKSGRPFCFNLIRHGWNQKHFSHEATKHAEKDTCNSLKNQRQSAQISG
jgi:hypothetical protein